MSSLGTSEQRDAVLGPIPSGFIKQTTHLIFDPGPIRTSHAALTSTDPWPGQTGSPRTVF
jgi:hypothetical protein